MVGDTTGVPSQATARFSGRQEEAGPAMTLTAQVRIVLRDRVVNRAQMVRRWHPRHAATRRRLQGNKPSCPQ